LPATASATIFSIDMIFSFGFSLTNYL